MPLENQILRVKTGVIALCIGLYVAGVIMLSIHLPFGISDRHKAWIVPTYAILGALALIELFSRRIVLGPDSIRVVSYADYVCRTIPRAMIKNITWEKGCGASLILQEGKGIRLPNVGRDPQGLANTIRAWLKKTDA